MKLVILFPRRGDPPPCPEGYEQYPGDPFIVTRKWPACATRSIKVSCATCKTPAKIPWCDFFDCLVTQDICHDCERPNKIELPMVNPP